MNAESTAPLALPVDAIGEAVRAHLRARRSLVVTAPTGSGKSTRLPTMALDAVRAPVLVVQPRRVACRGLAERVAQERGTPLGGEVGFAIRFEEKRGPDTRILFVTPGVALRMVAEDGLATFGAVIIDEFHERGWQTDLLAALVRGPGAPPVVLTSATVQGEALAARIGATHLAAPGRRFEVTLAWTDDVDAPTVHGLAERVAGAVGPMLGRVEGDILVFLPGRGEIRRCRDALRSSLRGGWEAVEVHGGVSPERLQRAFREVPGLRRLYLATNVAETSLTLPGVVQVVDSGLERRVVHRGGRNVLALMPIARAAMEQRAGRAGRVREGACLRLWSRRWRAREEEPPEVQRIALDEVVYRGALAGLEGERFELAPWVDAPPAFAVEAARARLRGAGLLDAGGCLTEAGHRGGRLPVDAHEARALTLAPAEIRPLLVDVLATLGWRRDPLLPLVGDGSEQEAVHLARRALLRESGHEPAQRVAVLRHADARVHRADARMLAEARRSARQLHEQLGVAPDRGVPSPACWERLGDVLLQAWPDAAFVLRERARRPGSRRERAGAAQPWTNGEVEVEVAPFEPIDPDHTPRGAERSPEAGVLLEVAWIGDGATGFRGRGSMLLPLSVRRLARAGVGEEVLGAVRLERRPVRVVGAVQRCLGEVVLEEAERPLKGAALREAVAGFILEGRLLAPAGDDLRAALHLLGILRDLPPGLWPEGLPVRRPEVPEDPAAWMRERLGALGLEHGDDLALLEPPDLALDLEEATGWPSWELERWAEEFPRIWEILGAEYLCEVRAGTGVVTLSPHNAEARRRGAPEAAVLPRFKGFRVRYRKASRVVPLRG